MQDRLQILHQRIKALCSSRRDRYGGSDVSDRQLYNEQKLASAAMQSCWMSRLEMVLYEEVRDSGHWQRRWFPQELWQVKTAAVITDMDQPLGYAVGNSLGNRAINTLNGNNSEDFKEVVFALALRCFNLLDELQTMPKLVH